MSSEDRLSKLPKSIILHILSFLPMRDVVSTTFLSKGWVNLWTTVPCLNFHEDTSENYDGIESFRNFVNRALMLWEGTQILKLDIDIMSSFDVSLSCDLDLWVRFAVRHNVQVLNICLVYTDEDVYIAPPCLNSCSSIRNLLLVRCGLQIHGSPAWNQLKSLLIERFCATEDLINRILLGTPQLEHLQLYFGEINENLSIQSLSLKYLFIEKCILLYHGPDRNKYKPSHDTVLKICCPNLEKLEIYGVLYCKCLLNNVSSLTVANIEFDNGLLYNFAPVERGDELLGETLSQILPSIQHVEKVSLSAWCVKVLGASLKKYLLSPLLNVKSLKLGVDGYGTIEVAVIINLLGIFPNLKMLVIRDFPFILCTLNITEFNDYLHAPFAENAPGFNENNFLEFKTSALSKSILGKLKTVDITTLFKRTSTFQFIEFLLKHACKLEKLVIRARLYRCGLDSCPQTCLFEIAKVVLNMPRSSPTAKVVFKTW